MHCRFGFFALEVSLHLRSERLLFSIIIILFLHDSRDCPETAVSLLNQKRLGSGSEPTKENICESGKSEINESGKNLNTDNVSYTSKFV